MAATTESADSYADDAPLMALFSTPGRTKLLSVFVAERGRDLSVSDLSRQADMSRTTVYDHLDPLLELGVIKENRTTSDGHSVRYQLNEDSEIAELCYQLEGVTLRRLLENNGQL